MKSRHKRKKAEVKNAGNWLHGELADLGWCNYLYLNILSAVTKRTPSVQ